MSTGDKIRNKTQDLKGKAKEAVGNITGDEFRPENSRPRPETLGSSSRSPRSAQLHLPSGRACVLRQRHRGSCLFLAPHQIDAQAVPYVA